MLHLNNLSVSLGGRPVLSQVHLTLEKGTIAAILGPSGSGKTTLLRTIMGLETPSSGKLIFQKNDLSSEKKIVVPPYQRPFSLVFQEFVLLPHLDVSENIALGLFRLSKSERSERIEFLLHLFNLKKQAHAQVAHLSGGEQQRVSFARALATRPEILLLDEPFSNLDKKFRHDLGSEIREILRMQSITTLLVTHDQQEAFFFSEKIHLIKDGKIVQSGSCREIYETPKNYWVASFIGDTNRVSGEDITQNFRGDFSQRLTFGEFIIRPERILITKQQEGERSLCKVVSKEYFGSYMEYKIELRSGSYLQARDYNNCVVEVGEKVALYAKDQDFIRINSDEMDS